MKFFSIASILSLAAVAIAVPTVELIERQTTNACSAEGGKQICCSAGDTKAVASSGSLLSDLLRLNLACVGVLLVNLNGFCSQPTSCCVGSSGPVNGLVNVAPNSVICSQLINL